MGRLIAPWIWESQYEPKSKAILWKRLDPSNGSVSFMKYNNGWKEITYAEIEKPEFNFPPATLQKGTPIYPTI